MDQQPSIKSSPFELFKEIPRPYLDQAKLKKTFLKLSASFHPDRIHQHSAEEKSKATQKFAELNEAYQVLKLPHARIKQLIELETGAKLKSIQAVPTTETDLFFQVGKLCQECDQLHLKGKFQETSALLKAVALRREQELETRLNEVHSKLDVLAVELEEQLQEIDSEWIKSNDHASALKSLEELGRMFSYLYRWKQQIQDRQVQLATA